MSPAEQCRNLADLNILARRGCARHQFHLALGRLLADVDAIWDADQVGILEFHPGAFVAVIENHVKARSLKLRRHAFSCRDERSIGCVRDRHHHLKRRDRRRQPESVLVVTLLDRGGQNTFDADSVAAHDRLHFFAALIEHARAHRLRVFVSQLEDVADLDRLGDLQRSAADRAAFTFRHIANIGNRRPLEVPLRRHIAEVVVKLIGPADHVLALGEGVIKDHDQSRRLKVFRDLQANWPEISCRRAKPRLQLLARPSDAAQPRRSARSAWPH